MDTQKTFDFAKGCIAEAIEYLDDIIEQPESNDIYEKASDAQVKLTEAYHHVENLMCEFQDLYNEVATAYKNPTISTEIG
jgi:hypothetical protein